MISVQKVAIYTIILHHGIIMLIFSPVEIDQIKHLWNE